MASGGVSGTGLALATAGGVILWAGLAGVTPLQIIKTVSSGKNPPAPDVGSLISDLGKELFGSIGSAIFGASQPTTSSSNNNTVNASADTGSAVANDALKYVGTPYKWGGADPSGWDCSGFVTYVLHHDLGYDLPDNTHTVTGQFLVWSGASTIPTSQAQAGDLVCWPTHIAIAISSTDCVGAENPSLGTITGKFTNMGPGGEGFVIRRLKAKAVSA